MASYAATMKNFSSEPARSIREFLSAAGELWCAVAHDEITWPVNGEYRCQRCGRAYRVPWEERARVAENRTTGGPRHEELRHPDAFPRLFPLPEERPVNR